MIGPMFRHERPQKGRFRQFHQIDAEIFGDPGPKSDAEIILLAMTVFETVGLSGLSLQVNSLGCPECRAAFREELKNYLIQKKQGLCEDCTRRAVTNPLRVFDCKVDGCKEVVAGAPSILDFVCGDCATHFRALQDYLASSAFLSPLTACSLEAWTTTPGPPSRFNRTGSALRTRCWGVGV